MRKKIELLMIIVLILATIYAGPQSAKYVMSTKVQTAKNCIVIDAGHGGEDPGKVGAAGTMEKNLNLAIAKKLKTCLAADGTDVILTRSTDESLEDAGASDTKVSDLTNRVKIMDENNPVLAVSIHQNSYPDSTIRGAQVFYFEQSEEGKLLAETIQQSLIELVDPSNTRAAKANDNYFILKKSSVPTVIVECGFLSNPTEEALLLDENYQEKLAEAIAAGIRAYLEGGSDAAENSADAETSTPKNK